MTTKEIIKKHIPEFHQWHEHCQEMVIKAMEAQKAECAERANNTITRSYSDNGPILTPKLIIKELTS